MDDVDLEALGGRSALDRVGEVDLVLHQQDPHVGDRQQVVCTRFEAISERVQGRLSPC